MTWEPLKRKEDQKHLWNLLAFILDWTKRGNCEKVIYVRRVKKIRITWSRSVCTEFSWLWLTIEDVSFLLVQKAQGAALPSSGHVGSWRALRVPTMPTTQKLRERRVRGICRRGFIFQCLFFKLYNEACRNRTSIFSMLFI